MEQDRCAQQIAFLLEADKLKTVLRQTLIADSSRRENDAEHSWHLALMAMVLFEHAKPGVDLGRVLQMATVHDLIELYAGDTFAYDNAGNESKEAREAEAADRLYAMLPPAQGAGLRALWEEFDAMETPDARYAAAVDRLQPFLNNSVTGWHTWKLGGVTREKVYARMDVVRTELPALWPLVVEMLEGAITAGEMPLERG